MRFCLRSHWVLHGGIIKIFNFQLARDTHGVLVLPKILWIELNLYLCITIRLLISLKLSPDDLLIKLKLSVKRLYFPDPLQISGLLTLIA